MNVQMSLPIPGKAQDELLLVCIRQVILDSFWSRERSTVQGNLNLVSSSLVQSEVMDLGGEVFSTLGLFPIGDRF